MSLEEEFISRPLALSTSEPSLSKIHNMVQWTKGVAECTLSSKASDNIRRAENRARWIAHGGRHGHADDPVRLHKVKDKTSCSNCHIGRYVYQYLHLPTYWFE